ncbi:hypothetical protein CTAYLR_003178 [Chrysophaeum taylorii]|uniref:FAS1 domain-containing protein n=1 Tax=Chrysophaeum taylorii TaxID=2483200 RepID=A0AAD7UC51_9STRA|nr:hypothetical protein CTAYLR_003178 [Chrysophaeum taylorii]
MKFLGVLLVLCTAGVTAQFNATEFVEVLTTLSNVTTVLTAVLQLTELESIFTGSPFTFFLPTDDAFEAAYDDIELVTLLQNQTVIASLLSYHLINGTRVLTTDFVNGRAFETFLEGETITTLTEPPGIQDATGAVAEITTADVTVDTGVFHVIDTVLQYE